MEQQRKQNEDGSAVRYSSVGKSTFTDLGIDGRIILK
jgi:hypothetical protein